MYSINHTDLLVWSNERVAKWLEEVGLGTFAANLVDSGVHGALMALDETFDVPALAHILQLSETESTFSLLQNQFDKLVAEYRIRKQQKSRVMKETIGSGRKD